MVSVVVVMIDRPKVAVVGGVGLTEHVRGHEVWRLRIQRVGWLRRRGLVVRWG